jgi:hypothetical protein
MPRLISAVARLLREHDAEPRPHLHQSAHGTAMPAVCYDRDCRYPRLDG